MRIVQFRKGNKQEQKLKVKLESREPIKVLGQKVIVWNN